jgi:dTDP-4-amino-4,6-dideoxygalactose transaminase
MMDLQAAIGMHQIERVEKYWLRRAMIWERYNEALSDLPLSLPLSVDLGTRPAFHLYQVLIDEQQTSISRDEFILALHRRKIGTGVHYRAIPTHSIYRKRFGWRTEDYPHAEAIGRSTVSLPLSAKLTDQDVEDVIGAVREVLTSLQINPRRVTTLSN